MHGVTQFDHMSRHTSIPLFIDGSRISKIQEIRRTLDYTRSVTYHRENAYRLANEKSDGNENRNAMIRTFLLATCNFFPYPNHQIIVTTVRKVVIRYLSRNDPFIKYSPFNFICNFDLTEISTSQPCVFTNSILRNPVYFFQKIIFQKNLSSVYRNLSQYLPALAEFVNK